MAYAGAPVMLFQVNEKNMDQFRGATRRQR